MNKMKRIRVNLEMSQADLAEALGISQTAISRMEAGTLAISKRTSLALDALKAKASKA